MDNLEGAVVDDCCIVSEADGSLSYQRFFREKRLCICSLTKKLVLFMDILLIFMLVLLAISLSFHLIAHSRHDEVSSTPLTLTVASINSTEVLLESAEGKEAKNVTTSSVLRAKMWRFRVILEDDEKRNSLLKFLCVVVMSLALIFLACVPFFICLYATSGEPGDKDWHLLEVKIQKRSEH